MGSLNPSHLGYRVLTHLPGIWVGGRPPHRPSIWCSTYPAVRGGTVEEMRKVDLDSIEEHRVAALIRHTRHEQQLRHYHDRNMRERFFNVGDHPTSHPRHQGNAQALFPLGRSLHRDGSHQSVNLATPVGRRPGRSQRLEYRAFMLLLSLEDLYQNKRYVLSSLVISIQ
jgi:hypothetical protein